MVKPDLTLDGLRDVRVYQSRTGYRFSVDALLLSSFVNIPHANAIVDLGTGSGIIGLLLARRYEKARVHLIELQPSLFSLCRQNITLNDLQNRVTAVNADIRSLRTILEPSTCDLVVSNPPFRRPGTGRLSLGDERAIARHELRVTISDVIDAAAFVLKGKGRFCMIYHPGRLVEVIDRLREKRLEPKRIRFVHNTVKAESKIVLIDAIRDGQAGLKIEKPLFLYEETGGYTAEVRQMYGAGLMEDLKPRLTDHL